MSRIRLLPTIGGLILTFIVLFGGYQIYRNFEVVQPLQVQLKQIHAVISARVVTVAQNPTVVVKLGEVSNLQTTYTQIQNVIVNNLGNLIPISIIDKRSAALKTAYEQMQPILFQGIAHGNYVSMISSFQKACQLHHIQCKLSMNNQYIFVQVTQQNSYLYDVVPYSIKSSGVFS
jgi:hypothetical protein